MTSTRITHKLVLEFITQDTSERKQAVQYLLDATCEHNFSDINFIICQCGSDHNEPCKLEFSSHRFDMLLSFEAQAINKLRSFPGIILHQ